MNEPKPWLAKPGGIAERLGALLSGRFDTAKAFAEHLGWAESKVSRIRRGVVAPSFDDLREWTAATDSTEQLDELAALLNESRSDERTFKDRMSRGQAAVQRSYLELVQASEVVRYFETVWIPGFVQTRDYAHAVFTEMIALHQSIDDIDAAIAGRMKRQQLLYEGKQRFEFLIAEPALHWDWVPARVMVPQLHFLATWLDAPNVRLGILPMRGGNVRPPQNSFQMYDDYVIVETFDSEIERGGPEMAKLYARIMDDLWERAVVGEAARELLTKAIRTWEA